MRCPHMRQILFTLCVALAVCASTGLEQANAQSLRLYRDADFGTTALVPATWRESTGEGGQMGAQFVSPDGSARIGVWAIADDGRDLRSYMRTITQKGDVRVTYDPLRRRWFVLSGLRGGRIFYTKVLRACGRLHHVALEYPAAEKRAFDSLVTRVSHSLRARC